MNRILYYSGFRMSVFHWLDDRLVDRYSFLPNEEGFKQFKYYLDNCKNETLRILVDVIEEDYFKDKLPHVSKSDRHTLLSRKILRNYPKCEDWFSERVVSRDKQGRKDDNIVYSVITNPETIKPWINILIESQSSVDGVFSLSVLSENLLRLMRISDKNCLLVSRQVPSNIRQSFFIDGELKTSRSGSVNLQETDLVEHINKEVNQTSSFLANQRYIGFDEVLVVHILASNDEIELLKSGLEDSALRKYVYHSLESVQSKNDIVKMDSDYADIIFTKLCQAKSAAKGQYGPAVLFKYNRLKSISKFSYYISAAVFILVCLSSLFIVYESGLLKEEIRLDEKNTRLIEADYNRELRPIQKQLDQALGMQSAVDLNKQLLKSRRQSIQRSLLVLSDIINKSGVDDVQLTSISWQKNKKSLISKKSNKTKDWIKYSSMETYFNQFTIFGYFSKKSKTVEELARKVSQLNNVLSSDSRIIDMKFSRLPIDIRPQSKINRMVKVDDENDSVLNRDQFEVQFLLKDV